MILLIVALALSFGSPAWATTYWVTNAGGAGSCAAASGEADPGAYRTKSQGIACLAAGDTLIIKSGEVITTTNGDAFNEFGSVPAGLSAAQPTRILCQGNRTCTIRPSSVPNGGQVIGLRPRSHIHIGALGQGFVVDAINANHTATAPSLGIRVNNTGMTADTTGIKIIGNKVINYNAFGISSNGLTPLTHRNMEWAYNDIGPRRPPLYETSDSHPIYLVGTDTHIHHNVAHANGGAIAGRNSYGLHCWHICRNTLWEYNIVLVEGPNARGAVVGGTQGAEFNHTFRYNTFRRVGSTAIDRCLLAGSGSRSVQVYNNTCDGFTVLFSNHANSTLNTFRNNVCTNRAVCSTVIDGGSPTVSNNVLTASTSVFVDANNSNYGLLSTATDLINLGVNVGLPFNGSAPDIGAHESIATPTASITANILTLTFVSNVFLPISNLSTTGLTVACTGSACPGSPTVATVTRRAGTDTFVDVTISGITGNACEAANQNWTATYNGSTGSWSDSMLLGGTNNQKVFSFTNLAATNACTGSGPPAPPAGLYISYAFNEGTGTTVGNTGSLGASGDGTLQNGVAWANGGGVTTTQQSTQYVAVPYGSGVNPPTQDLTVAFTIDVLPANTGSSLSYFGSQLVTNQRFHILTQGGTWRMGIGAFSGSASEFSVVSGPQHVCLTADGGTFTLHINGVASTTAGGLQTGVGSYTLASNFELGRIANLTTGGGGTYRHFQIYTSVENCNTIYQATLGGGGGSPTGTYSQDAYKAQDVFTTSAGTPVDRRAVNTPVKVAVNGAVALMFQVNCDTCSDTAFRVTARKNGSGSYLQMPNTETAEGIYMWGSSSPTYLNTGNPGAEISGSCTEQTGATVTTADQTPTVSFPSSACVVLRYLIRIGENANPGDYFELRLESQAGGPLDTYTNTARIDVVEKAMVQ